MNHIFLRLISPLVALILLTHAGVAEARWTKAETKHFVFYSSGRPSELETFAIETEKFDAMLRVRFNIPEDEIVNRLAIYVLPDSKAVSKLKGVPNGALGGFYQSRIEGSYAVSNREKADSKYGMTGKQVLFHEYTHHFFARHLASAYPQWLSEGFAEYYSTTEFEKNGIYTVGIPVWSRAYGLVQGQRLPIRTVLFSGTEKLDQRQTDIFYGRSWLLVHKLMSTQEGLRSLANYIENINAGMDPKLAAEQNFGDLDALDKALEKMERTPLTMFKAALPVTFDAGYVASELDEVQSRVIELRLQRLATDDPSIPRDELRRLAVANPGRADLLAELAQAEYALALEAESDEAENEGLIAAEGSTDGVLAIEPSNVRANVLKAKLLLERKGLDATHEDFQQARKLLSKANHADPLDPLPLYEYYRTFDDEGERPPPIALQGLTQSFYRAKEVTDFRVALAFALASEGRFDDAIPLIRFLAADPHAGEQGKAILDQLLAAQESFADYRARTGVDESAEADSQGQSYDSGDWDEASE